MYFNINTADDYNYAQFKMRSAVFGHRKVSVVIPAYNEEHSIGYVVRDFLPAVDEVLVVDNSSEDRTAEVARQAGARVETVRLKGYGDTIRHGLDCAEGDILVVAEADYSFRARDLSKLLEYLKDADMVIGTRTTREMVEQGTNMRGSGALGQRNRGEAGRVAVVESPAPVHRRRLHLSRPLARRLSEDAAAAHRHGPGTFS